MEIVIEIVIVFLLILAFLVLLKIIRGPSIWDRILCFNLFSAIIILIIIFYAHLKELPYLIDIAIIYALLGFIGIVFISRFVQGKGSI